MPLANPALPRRRGGPHSEFAGVPGQQRQGRARHERPGLVGRRVRAPGPWGLRGGGHPDPRPAVARRARTSSCRSSTVSGSRRTSRASKPTSPRTTATSRSGPGESPMSTNGCSDSPGEPASPPRGGIRVPCRPTAPAVGRLTGVRRDARTCERYSRRRYGSRTGRRSIIGFPGNKFTGQIAPALMELVDSGTVRVIDLLFVMKDEAGVVTTIAAEDLERGAAPATSPSTSSSRARLARRTPKRSATTSRRTARPCWSPSRTPGRRGSSTRVRAADGVLIDQIRIPADVSEAPSSGS